MKRFDQYLIGKDLHAQIQKLRNRGGAFTKAANEVADLIINLNLKKENAFDALQLTHNGESRIKHCIKYDLPGSVRLITVQDNGVCLLAYLGDHDDSHKWLETHAGMNLTIDKRNKVLVPVKISEDITEPEKRVNAVSDYSEGLLHLKLKEFYFKKIADKINYSSLAPFLRFDSTVDEDDLLEACQTLPIYELQSVFFDVYHALKSGDIEQAQSRILEYENELKLVSEASKEEIKAIKANDQFINIQELEAEFLKGILETKGWYEWMAFLHPDQRKVVDTDFKGSARLLGVSGSGKTSVLVHRAVRIAEQDLKKPVLIITLNESLAKLISDLIDLILQTKGKNELRKKIEIYSYWQLCKKMILDLKKEQPLIQKKLTNVTYKTRETIDEIWDEFYCQKYNNDDAKILFPLHQTLLTRNLYPQDYLRQEFDWVRSAFPKNSREEYLTVEREGRFIPIIEEDRKRILEGLVCWEKKMNFVGVVDYLGLSNMLHDHLDDIEIKYSHILVDEVQDFGTLELMIIRKLVAIGENDLFLCGDIAQQVYNKQHKLRTAGISILPEGFLKIFRNYRNGREILEAAYSVYESNVDKEQLSSDDFEILNPEYANFSSPKPFLRLGVNLSDEFNMAVQYLQENLDGKKQEKGCIAICGFSIFEINNLGEANNLPVLIGENELNSGEIYLSDLEQTKGFEFDRMIIINCTNNVFPNKALPREEWFREISKLYVAMTRAKKELIISYNGEFSEVFINCLSKFTRDNWSDHIDTNQNRFHLIESKQQESNLDLNISGLYFLYQRSAMGISKLLQNKLIEVVGGKNVWDEKSRRVGWTTMASLKIDVSNKKDLPTLSRLFGPSIFNELETLLSRFL